MWLYVLELHGNRFYVGTTKNVEQRVAQHKSSCGSAWTKRHNFVRLLETRLISSPLEEDTEVKKLMALHGIDNVRGGSYSQNELTPTQKKSLQSEMDHASGRCLRCGRDSHWVAQCFAKKHLNGQDLEQKQQQSRDLPHKATGQKRTERPWGSSNTNTRQSSPKHRKFKRDYNDDDDDGEIDTSDDDENGSVDSDDYEDYGNDCSDDGYY